METRGLRNCNPLNIRRVAGKHWKGEIVAPIEDKDFCQFTTLEHGIRAAYQILDTYRRKYHAVCIEEIITRWAPPSEKQGSTPVNDTESYIHSVCTLTGFGGKERLTPAQWPALVKAMALIESRMHLDENILRTAYNLYLNLKR